MRGRGVGVLPLDPIDHETSPDEEVLCFSFFQTWMSVKMILNCAAMESVATLPALSNVCAVMDMSWPKEQLLVLVS